MKLRYDRVIGATAGVTEPGEREAVKSTEDTMACAGCVSPSDIVDDEYGDPVCLVPLRPELHDDCRASIDAYETEVRRGLRRPTPRVTEPGERTMISSEAWTAYTPTISQRYSLPKTVHYARYKKIGRLVAISVAVTFDRKGYADYPIVVSTPFKDLEQFPEMPAGIGVLTTVDGVTYPLIAELKGKAFLYFFMAGDDEQAVPAVQVGDRFQMIAHLQEEAT